MEGSYGVYFGKQFSGKVQVIRQGLYYRIVCRCQLSGDVVCRLHVKCGSNQENLGVVIPMGEGFGLETRIPVKRLGEGPMEFCLVPKHEAGKFIPIYPDEPFAYISHLKQSYLIRQNGQIGIGIKSS